MTKQTNKTATAKNSLIWTAIGSFVIGASLAGGITYVSVAGGKGDDIASKGVVAKLGDKEITSTELYDSMVKSYGTTSLEGLVADRLTLLEAEKEGIKIKDDAVQAELDKLVAEYGSQDALEEALKAYGQGMDDLKEDITTYLKLVELLSARVDTSEKALKEYYEKNKVNYDQKEQVRASHILVADEKTAKEVLAKLKEGTEWDELAKTYSQDYYAEAKDKDGSDLGYFGHDEMDETFEKAAFALKVGEISEPVKTEHGYHIIKVTDKAEAKESTFETAKEQVKKTLLDEAMKTEYSAWYEEKLADYKYENFLEPKEDKKK